MEDALRIECGVKPFSREETKDHTWELLDYGNFVIDVFQPEAREYYRLETLWNDAPIVDLSEAGIEHPEYSGAHRAAGPEDGISKRLGLKTDKLEIGEPFLE